MEKTYILDTSVILHNWKVLKQHRTMVIPRCVLDEIKQFQQYSGDLGDNARNASHWLFKQLQKIDFGNEINTENSKIIFWKANTQRNHDDKIIQVAKQVNNNAVILTKSISLRVKAKSSGILSEDYDDVGLVSDINGWQEIELNDEDISKLKFLKDETFTLPQLSNFTKNEYFIVTKNGQRYDDMVYRHLGNGTFIVPDKKPHLCGLVPRNPEQIMLADALKNDDIPLVTCIGQAGSGKSLLAIATAMQKVMMQKKYRKIIITRPIMPIGRDLGFLPGTVDEKMAEWIRPFMDNIDYIKNLNYDNGKRKIAASKINALLDDEARKEYMQILPLTYIRGSSISNAYIIVDEAQNATPAEMKTIITRVGQNSKLVLAGDIQQIDNRFYPVNVMD